MRIAHKPVQDRRLLGIGLALGTFVLFTLTDVCAKWLTQAGIPPAEVAFLRFSVHFVLIASMLLPRYGLGAFGTDRLPLQLVRAACLLVTTTSNFFAVKYLPLTITGTFSFLMPLLICALSVPLLGEHVGWRRWLAILIGFSGILIIIQPGDGGLHWALIFSMGMVVAGALYFILTRLLTRTESTATLQLYGGLIGTVCLAPFALADWVWPTDPLTWLALCAIGFAAVLGHQLSIMAHALAPASTLAPFAYTQIIWMSLASWLIFAQPPTFWLYVGAPIVIGSGLYIWLREQNLAKSYVKPASASDTEGAATTDARDKA